MTTELWITIGIAIASGLAVQSYRHPSEFRERLTPIVGALLAAAVILVLAYNAGVQKARSAMSDYENQLDFEIRAAVDVFDATEPACVPAWFLAVLAGTWVYMLFLQFLELVIHNEPDPPSNSESEESPPSPEPPKEE